MGCCRGARAQGRLQVSADPNAKLRRLREWACCIHAPHPDSFVVELRRLLIRKIDDLLAEPEPQCTEKWLCGTEWCRCTLRQGHDGAHRDEPALERLRRPPRREPLEQEIARLYGHEGR